MRTEAEESISLSMHWSGAGEQWGILARERKQLSREARRGADMALSCCTCGWFWAIWHAVAPCLLLGFALV